MPPSLYALLPPVWAWILCACCVSAPRPEALLAVGFQTPEQTFRTFQTGLRADLLGLEYRCLSRGFKQRNGGVTELGWRVFRDENRWLRYAAKAEIVEQANLPDGRARIVATLDTLFVDETFAVDFVRQDFYETFDDGGLLEDDYVRWREIARAEGDSLVLEVPMPEGVDVLDITELRAGREWKIDSIERLTETP